MVAGLAPCMGEGGHVPIFNAVWLRLAMQAEKVGQQGLEVAAILCFCDFLTPVRVCGRVCFLFLEPPTLRCNLPPATHWTQAFHIGLRWWQQQTHRYGI